jgi:4-amino-4-deoxy-L-arabinose transferase-like glycosyltransferase
MVGFTDGLRGDILRVRKGVARTPLVVWLIPVIWLAFTIRTLGLGTSDLWLDEAVSFFIARQGPLGILKYTASHFREHPPGYYLQLWAWMNLAGTSEYALRFWSAVGGTLSVPLIAVLARASFGKRVALLAAILMALHPLAVQQSRDARMYAWLMTFALLGAFALVRALKVNRWRDWGLFAVAFLLGVATHYLAALILLAYMVFLALRWRRSGQRYYRFAAVTTLLIVLPMLWIGASPGPRNSFLSLMQKGAQRDWVSWVSSLEIIVTRWPLGSITDGWSPSHALLLAVVPWLLFLVGFVAPLRLRTRSKQDTRQLLFLIACVPPLVGSMLMPFVVARHHSAVLGIYVLGLALGVVLVLRRFRVLGLVTLIALLALEGSLAISQVTGAGWRPSSPPIAYAQARAGDHEPVVYTDPWDAYFDLYYNQRELPSYYVPATMQPSTIQSAEDAILSILKGTDRFWLITKPGDYNPEATERASNAVAYPADKVWFPESRAVVHYFGPVALQQHSDSAVWPNMVRMNSWSVSSTDLPAGDALRLKFEWQALQDKPQGASVTLSLYGPDNAIWAERTSEPCDGLCPMADWPNTPIEDRYALYVPSDVPPGRYSLRLMWLVDGAPVLFKVPGEDNPQQELELASVVVHEPANTADVAPMLDKPVQAKVNANLALRSTATLSVTKRAGAELTVPMQWEIGGAPDGIDLSLVLRSPSNSYSLPGPIGPSWYRIQDWNTGRTVRNLSHFRLPGNIAPGLYKASLKVQDNSSMNSLRVEIGTVEVEDRSHSFTVPQDGQAMDCTWQEGIRLVRLNMPANSRAGEGLNLSLIWKADGPTKRDWKVFLHLVDADGTIRAQRDAYPMEGGASTLSWQTAEVLTDNQVISLPPDLPAGRYRLQIGFYDAETNERLMRTDGTDLCTVPVSVVGR